MRDEEHTEIIAEVVLDHVGRLISACTDSAKGFAEASRDVRSEALQTLLADIALERKQFVEELQTIALAYGKVPRAVGSIAGAVHRGLLHAKSSIARGDDNSILADCLTGEQWVHQVYGSTLQQPLPEDVRTITERQFKKVLRVEEGLVQWQQGLGTLHKAD